MIMSLRVNATFGLREKWKKKEKK